MPRGLVQGRAVWGTVSLAGNIVPVACGYNHKIPWLGYCGGIPNDADHVLMSGGKVTDTFSKHLALVCGGMGRHNN